VEVKNKLHKNCNIATFTFTPLEETPELTGKLLRSPRSLAMFTTWVRCVDQKLDGPALSISPRMLQNKTFAVAKGGSHT
jgi:hypothetical protein